MASPLQAEQRGGSAATTEHAAGGERLAWRNWSEDIFEIAKRENKFVLLDLEAVWCHWCHVMAETTYEDPKVAGLIESKYIAVRADQDAHPDLSLRYEDWGWPATIVFAPDGKEIVKRQGYIPPERMASLLEAIIKDPTPGPSVLPETDLQPAENFYLAPEQAKRIRDEHDSLYDQKFGGWGKIHKLIEPSQVEYALVKAQAGDAVEEQKVKRTLEQALNLVDREWGGFYQYSDEADWKSPHYEKIMWIQANNMRLYALAYGLWKTPAHLEAVRKTAEYVASFWTDPDGAFYTSQDADVGTDLNGRAFYSLTNSKRRDLGRMPRIDTHLYARENGWMIDALCSFYNITGDPAYLNPAFRAARWIITNRSLPEGGFRHDAEDRAGPYLGDTLAMGQAFLGLYAATADREWLDRAEQAARFIEGNFKDPDAGFFTSSPPKGAQGVFAKAVRQLDENVSAARWLNLLFQYTGNQAYRTAAEHAMRYLTSPKLLERRSFLAGVLIADEELARDPMHLTVVGAKSDAQARALFDEARRTPSDYKRIEWWDPREGALPNPDVKYPELDRPALFLCVNKRCSFPMFEPGKLADAARRSKKPAA